MEEFKIVITSKNNNQQYLALLRRVIRDIIVKDLMIKASLQEDGSINVSAKPEDLNDIIA